MALTAPPPTAGPPPAPPAAQPAARPVEQPAPGLVVEPPLPPVELVPVLGRALVWLGGLLVAFALFQVWGTGLLEWHAQRALGAELDATLAVSPIRGAGPADRQAAGPEDGELDLPTAAPTTVPAPAIGSPIARIDIPAIGVTKTIVEGVDRDTLRDGPGHYPSTALPGRAGNAAIAGHRTTHGAPFRDLDRLRPGDHIEVETVDGVFRYEVQGHAAADGTVLGHHIVDPSEVRVIADHGDDRLTLTACHPRYSARQRIVVSALLVGEPAPAPVGGQEASRWPAAADLALSAGGTTAAPAVAGDPSDADGGQAVGVDDDLLDQSLGWQADQLDPTVLWATVTLLVLHGGWVLGRLWRPTPAYVMTAPVALAALFTCFVHLDRLLPAF